MNLRRTISRSCLLLIAALVGTSLLLVPKASADGDVCVAVQGEVVHQSGTSECLALVDSVAVAVNGSIAWGDPWDAVPEDPNNPETLYDEEGNISVAIAVNSSFSNGDHDSISVAVNETEANAQFESTAIGVNGSYISTQFDSEGIAVNDSYASGDLEGHVTAVNDGYATSSRGWDGTVEGGIATAINGGYAEMSGEGHALAVNDSAAFANDTSDPYPNDGSQATAINESYAVASDGATSTAVNGCEVYASQEDVERAVNC